MQLVAVLSHPARVGESIRIAQRIYKAGHEALNLDLLLLHHHIIPRKPDRWEHSLERLAAHADALIVFEGLEHFNRLTAFCMQENLPVYLTFDEWNNSLSD